MIIHADMPCFGEYTVSLDKTPITPQVYMADDVHGIVITRNWFAGSFLYERKEGKVLILHAPSAPLEARSATV